MVKNPLDLPKYSQTIKQKKQVAGILGQDVAPAPVVINIESIEKVQIATAAVLRDRIKSFKDTTTK